MARESDCLTLLLAPHHDDETLFAGYLCLAHKPLVLVCYPGARRHGSPEIRQAETAKAMEVLGCRATIAYGGSIDLEEAILAAANPDEIVLAPLPEAGGHSDHNRVGNLAAKLFPGRVLFYTTYTQEGRSTSGDPVQVKPGWEKLKRLALACYPSQLRRAGTRAHFYRPLDEYTVTP